MPGPAESTESSDASHFPLSGLALRAGELLILGQRLGDVNLRAVMEEGGWQARLSSKEASGDILWRDQGRGRLQARFKQLSVGSAQGTPKGAEAAAVADEERLSALPGLDVSPENFILRGRCPRAPRPEGRQPGGQLAPGAAQHRQPGRQPQR